MSLSFFPFPNLPLNLHIPMKMLISWYCSVEALQSAKGGVLSTNLHYLPFWGPSINKMHKVKKKCGMKSPTESIKLGK